MNNLDFVDSLEYYLQNPGALQYGSTGYQVFDAVTNLISLAIRVLMIIGLWKMYDKAGENGWGSIIPFYRGYLLFKTAGIRNWFWGSLVVSIVYAVCLTIGMIYFMVYFIGSMFGGNSYFNTNLTTGMGVLIFVGVIAGLANFVIIIYRGIKLSQAFNLSGGWAVGIILLPWIFYMIIGCSNNIHHRNFPFGVPKPGVGAQPGYQQDPYRQNTYQQSGYAQNPYQQNAYQQNGYAQNPYQQNAYQQNGYAQNPYAGNPYMQNQPSQASQASQPAQAPGAAQNPYQQSAQTPEAAQNPYQQPPQQEVWKTIYDDNKNNL